MVLGQPAGAMAARRRLGYLPELFRYQGWMQAEEVLGWHHDLARLPRSGREGDCRAALEMVGLQGRGGDRVEAFSKGMQQRLGLAVALLGRPELVLLDEPTSALDPLGRHDVREIIKALHSQGTTVFLNSHLLSEVERVCDTVAIVDHGRVIAQGDLKSLGRPGGIRLKAQGVSAPEVAALAGVEAVALEGEWLYLRGLSEDQVPSLVARLVARGAQIFAVEPERDDLEETFLKILGAS